LSENAQTIANPANQNNAVNIYADTYYTDSDIFSNFLELFIQSFSLSGLELGGTRIIVEIITYLINRPYLIQYLVMIMFGAVIKFTYFLCFNNPISTLITRVIQIFAQMTKVIEGLKKAEKKVQEIVAENKNNEVTKTSYNFIDSLKRYVHNPIAWIGSGAILGGSTVLAYFRLNRSPSTTINLIQNPPGLPTITSTPNVSNSSGSEIRLPDINMNTVAIAGMVIVGFILGKIKL